MEVGCSRGLALRDGWISRRAAHKLLIALVVGVAILLGAAPRALAACSASQLAAGCQTASDGYCWCCGDGWRLCEVPVGQSIVAGCLEVSKCCVDADCGSGGLCRAWSDRSCGCTSGLTSCGANCVDTQSNFDNCGQCGNRCPANGFCAAGSCGCGAGEVACNGRCVDLSSDRSSCGQCGVQCTSNQLCVNGSCVGCPSGQTVCGGRCVDTSNDVSNCGQCDNTCPAPPSTTRYTICGGGQCKPLCKRGFADCGGTCVNLLRDDVNCGVCGDVCLSEERCLGGRCRPKPLPLCHMVAPPDPGSRACDNGVTCKCPLQRGWVCLNGWCRKIF